MEAAGRVEGHLDLSNGELVTGSINNFIIISTISIVKIIIVMTIPIPTCVTSPHYLGTLTGLLLGPLG